MISKLSSQEVAASNFYVYLRRSCRQASGTRQTSHLRRILLPGDHRRRVVELLLSEIFQGRARSHIWRRVLAYGGEQIQRSISFERSTRSHRLGFARLRAGSCNWLTEKKRTLHSGNVSSIPSPDDKYRRIRVTRCRQQTALTDEVCAVTPWVAEQLNIYYLTSNLLDLARITC